MTRFLMLLLLFANCFSACTRIENKESRDLPTLEVPHKVSEQRKYNSVIKQDVKVFGLPLESSKQDVTEKLGKPAQIKEAQNEFDGSVFYEYLYGNNTLQISSSDTLTGFDLKVGEVQINARGIKIGDPEQIVEDYFSESYKNKLENNDKNEQIVRIQLNDEGEYLLILLKNGMINEVLTWSSE